MSWAMAIVGLFQSRSQLDLKTETGGFEKINQCGREARTTLASLIGTRGKRAQKRMTPDDLEYQALARLKFSKRI